MNTAISTQINGYGGLAQIQQQNRLLDQAQWLNNSNQQHATYTCANSVQGIM